MQRLRTTPRPDWQKIVESQGFLFHSPDEQPYWDEGVYYRFTSAEIDAVEKASYALNDMCLKAVQHVIDNKLFERFTIPPPFVDYVVSSWERDEFTLYGRFDLAFDGRNPPKLLEYNADTPTSLLEAAVIQWHWMKDMLARPGSKIDQFNSIHERLIEAWRSFKSIYDGTLYFSAMADVVEDHMTVAYLRDTAAQAGMETRYIAVEQIGWDRDRRCFVDEFAQQIGCCFKLYPWEWMVREQFAPNLLEGNTRWLEAPWKMILSNKAILAVLWELFPDSPYLLPAAFDPEPVGPSYVRKPILGREGANVTVTVNGRTTLETEGIYGGPYVYQRLYPLPRFDGQYPVIGSWMVNGYACGMGIREDATPVTGNTSRFVPHVFA